MEDTAPTSCGICNDPLLTGQAAAASPACNCIYHTACVLDRMQHMLYYHPYQDIKCGACNALLQPALEHSVFTHDTQMGAAETANAQLLENTTFRTEYKGLKKKVAAARKAGAAYRKGVTAAKRAWMDEIQTHLAEIKAARENAISTFQDTDTYKTWRKLTGSLSLAEAKFAKKHNLNRYQTRILFPHRGSYRRALGGARPLKWAFYLRL